MKDIARIHLEYGCDFEEKGKLKQAFNAYLKSAKLGNKEAQVNLANLYGEGNRCPKNSNKAIYWYKRSFKLGCSEAAYCLGIHYKHLGKKRLAIYWFEKSMQADNGDAALQLAKLNIEINSNYNQNKIKDFLNKSLKNCTPATQEEAQQLLEKLNKFGM